MPDPKLLDTEVTGKLLRDFGLEDTRYMLDVLLADIEQRCQTMQQARAARDLQAIGDQAHALKSACMIYGTFALAESLKQLEQEARAGEAACWKRFEATRELMQETRAALETLDLAALARGE